MTIGPPEEIYRLKSGSNTESVVTLKTAEVAQAGMKGCKCEGDVIFAGEIHPVFVRIYQNVSHN